MDAKYPVQPSQLDDFDDLRFETAKMQLSVCFLDHLVEHDEFVECPAGQELDVGEVEQQTLPLVFGDEPEEFVTHFGNVGRIDDFVVVEADNRYITDFRELDVSMFTRWGAPGGFSAPERWLSARVLRFA